jgi:hypothetical protein
MYRLTTLVFGSLVLASSTVLAHHSGAAFFDIDSRIEIAGEVTNVRWRNPHVAFNVTVTGEDGQQEDWVVESNALNMLERQGVSADTVAVGDEVRFWGPPSRSGNSHMRAYNALLPDGTEVVLIPRTPPERRWDDHEMVASIPELANKDAGESIAQADGIFRVWDRGRIKLLNPELPLTASAAAAKAAFDPLKDDPVLQCIPTSMPGVMDVSFPIEFSARGDDILLRLEQWDTVRMIHMGGDPGAAAGMPATREGYSVGRWEGGALVVETSNIDSVYFDDVGTPLSDAVYVVERFKLSDDENSLHWQATTTDPETFTEPVVLEQTFPWVPGEEIKPYDCVTAG